MDYSRGWRVSYKSPIYLRKYNERYSAECERNILYAKEINRQALETITHCPSIEDFQEKCKLEKDKNLKRKKRIINE